MRIHLHPLPPVTDPVEVVERKGLGHPDTLADALAEAWSVALSRWYLERFGRILHHNVDKALLFAGASRPAFGGGDVVEPMRVYLAGRVTTEVAGDRVPAEAIAVEAARACLRRSVRHLDPERHVEIVPLVRGGAAELADLAAEEVPLAGDTSYGVGHAPASALERLVLGVERDLTSPATLAAFPSLGEDVKVMGVHVPGAVELTVAAPLVDRHVADPVDYLAKKERVRAHVATATGVPVLVNAADLPERGRYYLTVTGTSAEGGDDGQVGRGNRATGLITPGRPMTLEAIAGKNPRNHAGKLYALAAQRLAEGVVVSVPGVRAAESLLVSRIGQRLDQPWVVRLRIGTDGRALADVARAVEERVRAELAALPELTRRIVAGELPA